MRYAVKTKRVTKKGWKSHTVEVEATTGEHAAKAGLAELHRVFPGKYRAICSGVTGLQALQAEVAEIEKALEQTNTWSEANLNEAMTVEEKRKRPVLRAKGA